MVALIVEAFDTCIADNSEANRDTVDKRAYKQRLCRIGSPTHVALAVPLGCEGRPNPEDSLPEGEGGTIFKTLDEEPPLSPVSPPREAEAPPPTPPLAPAVGVGVEATATAADDGAEDDDDDGEDDLVFLPSRVCCERLFK